jgi:transcriptional regulator with XRE-family HTH domain
MSQGELAAAVLDSSRPATVSDWERGKRTPDAHTLTRIADALGVSVGYLLGENGEAARGLAPVDGDGLAELYRRWDQIEEAGGPQWLRALRQDVLVALVRADAMRQEGVAARERAAALREEAAATRDRSHAVREEAEASKVRALKLPDEKERERPEAPPYPEDAADRASAALGTKSPAKGGRRAGSQK